MSPDTSDACAFQGKRRPVAIEHSGGCATTGDNAAPCSTDNSAAPPAAPGTLCDSSAYTPGFGSTLCSEESALSLHIAGWSSTRHMPYLVAIFDTFACSPKNNSAFAFSSGCTPGKTPSPHNVALVANLHRRDETPSAHTFDGPPTSRKSTAPPSWHTCADRACNATCDTPAAAADSGSFYDESTTGRNEPCGSDCRPFGCGNADNVDFGDTQRTHDLSGTVGKNACARKPRTFACSPAVRKSAPCGTLCSGGSYMPGKFSWSCTPDIAAGSQCAHNERPSRTADTAALGPKASISVGPNAHST